MFVICILALTIAFLSGAIFTVILSWNAAATSQATDRAHRIGQEKTVTVFKLICRDTIEEKILRLQEKKRDLAEEILSGEGATFSSMTREELMALLEAD